MKHAVLALLMLTATATVMAQEQLPPPFPRTNATKLFENDRINVWNIVWPKGQPTAMHRHIYDQVGTYYARGGRVITTPDGEKRSNVTDVGSLSTTRKGTTHIEEGNTDPPLQAVFIELKKDTASGSPVANVGPSPFPFPRANAKQVLDDERVTAWDATWTPGSEGFIYRAARETVIVFLGDGRVQRKGSSASGAMRDVTSDVRAGTMLHLDRGSDEGLEMVSGAPRALFFELK
jgi:hypothetical protein